MVDAVADLGAQEFVTLTTYKRSGDAVAAPVWVVPLADGRVGFWTAMGSGKTKRLAHTSRVEVQPCDARGRVTAGTEPSTGTAEMVRSGAAFGRVPGGLDIGENIAVERIGEM